MLKDDEWFPAHTTMDSLADEEVTEHSEQYANDDFDDVFGSEPPSPTFADDDPANRETRGGNLEYSDIPRLKEKHQTEGYRDGVTKGKAESVQKGFDEGYSLGAILGLRIGKILGLLEGIHGALKIGGENSRTELERVEGLWIDAKKELGTQGVFGGKWWGEDGVWKFEVPGEKDGKEVLFPDVAGAHPLVLKWQGVMDEEVKRWGLELDIVEGEHDHEDDDVKEAEETKIQSAKSTNKVEEVEATPAQAKILGVAKKDLNW